MRGRVLCQIGFQLSGFSPFLQERIFLSVSNYIFTAIFVAEMMVKVPSLRFQLVPLGLLYSKSQPSRSTEWEDKSRRDNYPFYYFHLGEGGYS